MSETQPEPLYCFGQSPCAFHGEAKAEPESVVLSDRDEARTVRNTEPPWECEMPERCN